MTEKTCKLSASDLNSADAEKNVFERIVDRLLSIVRTFDDGMGDV